MTSLAWNICVVEDSDCESTRPSVNMKEWGGKFTYCIENEDKLAPHQRTFAWRVWEMLA